MTDVHASSEDDGLLVKQAKRPRITLEPYDERKVEVIHDDGQEIYEPVPTLSEKFLQLVHKVRAQQQEQQQQQQLQQQQAQQKDEPATETTTVAIKNDRPITHFLHMARMEVEFMGHVLDMIRDGLYMLPHVTKAQNTANIQVNEIAIPLEGKKMVLQRAAERIRKAAHSLEATIAKDHEGYLPSLLALRSRWRFHASATHSPTPTQHGISHKIAVDYGHSTIGGPSYPTAELPEASVMRSKDDGGLELTFKKTPDVDLHLVLTLRDGQEGEGGRGRELVLSARSLSAVGPEGSEVDRGMTTERQAKLGKSVKRLIRAHECQFNEELFQKLVSETENKDDRKIGRARFIEDAVQIDSGHFGSGSCLSIRKGTEGNYSHNAPPLHQLHIPQVLLIAARRLYLNQCLQSAQQMQTLTLRPTPSSSSNSSSTSVLGGICDIFLHIDLRTDVMNTLEKMAEIFPIAIHWTSHGPSKSSCVIRNSFNHTNFHLTATPLSSSHNSTPTLTQIHTYNTQTKRRTNTTEVDGGVIVFVSGREITCTISSCTMRVVNPRELVGFIKNYFRFL